MLKYIISLVLFTLIYIQSAEAQVGLFIRPNSSSLSSPVSGQTWLFNSSNNTVSVFNGSAFQLTSQAQGNFAASTDPATSNDNTQGYSTGSVWYNTNDTKLFICTNATTSAAVWVLTNDLPAGAIALTKLAQGSATTGQSLMWNGTNWAPSNPLVSLNNILQTGALTGQVPSWNGTNWVPVSLAGAGAAPATPTFVTVDNQTTSLPNSSRLLAGTGIGLTTGTNTLTIAATGVAVPTLPTVEPGNMLYMNGSANMVWMPNYSTAVGSFLWWNGSNPAWNPALTNAAGLTVPILSAVTNSVTEIPGLLGVDNNANSPRTSATDFIDGSHASLITCNPDGAGGMTVNFQNNHAVLSGQVYAIKNIGTVSNVTLSLSPGAFNLVGGSTTQVITPGQCLFAMLQKQSTSVDACIWIIISLM